MHNSIPRALFSCLLLFAAWEVYCQRSAVRIVASGGGVDTFKKAMKWDSDEPDYYYKLGILARDQLEYFDLSTSKQCLETALEFNPDNWKYWLDLGRTLELLGLEADAEAAYRKAVTLNPRSGVYRWNFANFLLRAGKRGEALREFKEALLLDSSYRGALENLWRYDISAH